MSHARRRSSAASTSARSCSRRFSASSASRRCSSSRSSASRESARAGWSRSSARSSTIAPSSSPGGTGRCLPYGEGITFWALGEVVKAEAGILESDDAGRGRREARAGRRGGLRGRVRARVARVAAGAARRRRRRGRSGRSGRGVHGLAAFPGGDGGETPGRARRRGPALGRRRAARLPRAHPRLGAPVPAARRSRRRGPSSTTAARTGAADAGTPRRSRSRRCPARRPRACCRACSSARCSRPRPRRAARAGRRKPALHRAVRAHALRAGRRGEACCPGDGAGADRGAAGHALARAKALLQDACVVGRTSGRERSPRSAAGARDDVLAGIRELVRREFVRPAASPRCGAGGVLVLARARPRRRLPQIPRARAPRSTRRPRGSRSRRRSASPTTPRSSSTTTSRRSSSPCGGRRPRPTTSENALARFLVLAGDSAMQPRHRGRRGRVPPCARALRDASGARVVLVRLADALQERAASRGRGGYEEAIAALRARATSEAPRSRGRISDGRSGGTGRRCAPTTLTEEAIAILEREPGPDLVARVRARPRPSTRSAGAPQQAIEWAEKGLALARELGVENVVRHLQMRGLARIDRRPRGARGPPRGARARAPPRPRDRDRDVVPQPRRDGRRARESRRAASS